MLGKSGGPEGIVPELVVNTMNDISEILLVLLNEIFNTDCFLIVGLIVYDFLFTNLGL